MTDMPMRIFEGLQKVSFALGRKGDFEKPILDIQQVLQCKILSYKSTYDEK
jgi:hypothetical protein